MLQLKIFNIDKLNNEEIFSLYYASMSPERKRKIDKCRQDSDRKRSLGVGILIDEFLQENNLGENRPVCKVNESGKPYFDEFCFNASHSGKYAVCTFSDREVGCDIEQLENKNLRVAKRFFTESEKKYIFDKSCDDLLNERFVRVWTLKESYVKCLGTGLTKFLSSFSLQNLSDDSKITNIYFGDGEYEKIVYPENSKKSRATVIDCGNPADCCFYEYKLPDACISICVKF